MPDLVLLRHGQSQWNLENRFTGWYDCPLIEKGRAEARAAGPMLADADLLPDTVHTSLQQRAIEGYSGIRISSTGRRFQIHNARLWCLSDPDGRPCGQAAAFSDWWWI